MQNPVRRRNRWNEDTEKLAESHAHCGNRSSLNNQKKRPSVEKSPERAERLAQVNILTASSRHHGGQLAVAQSSDDGHEAGDKPSRNQKRGGIYLSRNFSRNNKDAGADHRTHNQHGRAGQAKSLHQFFILVAMNFPVARDPHCWLRVYTQKGS